MKIVPCPDCYGGHFRPCQVCGDSGTAFLIECSPKPTGKKILEMKTKNTPKLSRHEKKLVKICCEETEIELVRWDKLVDCVQGKYHIEDHAIELATILQLSHLIRKLSKKGKA